MLKPHAPAQFSREPSFRISDKTPGYYKVTYFLFILSFGHFSPTSRLEVGRVPGPKQAIGLPVTIGHYTFQ